MKNVKRVLAILTIVIILGLYITTLTLAILGKPYENMFTASLIVTIAFPTMLYIIVWLRKVLSDHINN